MKLTAAQRAKRERDKVEKRMTRFADQMERKTDAATRRLAAALDSALTAMSAFDDLRMDMDEFDFGDDAVTVRRSFNKRFDEVYGRIEKYDEQSDTYDTVNTLHSKVIGVIE